MLLNQLYQIYFNNYESFVLHISYKKCYDYFIEQENIKDKKLIYFINKDTFFDNIERNMIKYYKNEEDKEKEYQLFKFMNLSIPIHYNEINKINYPVIVKTKKSAGGLGINCVSNKNNLNQIYDPNNCILEEYLSEYTFYSIYLELNDENNYIITLCLKMHYKDKNSFKYFMSEKIKYDDYFLDTKINEEIEKIKKYYKTKLNNKYSILSIDFAVNNLNNIKIIEINNRIGVGKIAQIYNQKFKNFEKWFTILLWNETDLEEALKKIKNKEIFLVNFRYIPKYLSQNDKVRFALQLLCKNKDDLIDLYNSLNKNK